VPVAGLLGQPGHRFLEFVVFAVAVVLIILGPTVIDLLKGNSTSGLSRSTIAYAVLGIVALSLALVVIEKPFAKGDPNQDLARLVLVAMTTTLASVTAFYFGGRTASEAAEKAAAAASSGPTQPAIAIATPEDGATYQVGANVKAQYSAASPAGIESCVGKVDGQEIASGSPLPLGAPGSFIFEVTAVDKASGKSTAVAQYTVA